MKRAWEILKEEPYRVFFPLGMLAGIWGVMMWPVYHAGWLGFYPVDAHTRLMIEGFMGAFVMGFIGTAFPRLTGNHKWFGWEFLLLLALWTLMVGSHARGHVQAGDSAFSMMLLVLFLGMAGRWFFGNRDTPPPGFILAFAGILGAGAAAGFLAYGAHATPAQTQWAKLWLYQGFLLLPLMGIGPYLLPRFFGVSSTHSFDDSVRPPAGWWRKFLLALIAGLWVVAGFAFEVAGMAMAGQLLRGGVVLAWFTLETPLFRRAKLSTTPGNTVRWAVLGLAAGYACAAFLPWARVGSLHLFFASGLGMTAIAVGTRVVLGHAGRHDLLGGKIVWLRWVAGLLVLAAVTRMSADLLPTVRLSHLNYAAWTWAIGGFIWLHVVAKYLTQNEDSPKPASKCPRRGGKRQD